MKENNRILHVYGEDENGKSEITSHAARYALQRVYPEIFAAHHIKIENINTFEEL